MLLSITICTRNRASELVGCLPEIIKQAKKFNDVEILVIDNGSTDNTKQVVRETAATFDFALRYIHEPMAGLCQARNRGRAEAKSEVIVYIDDDERVEKDWIANIRLHFLNEKSDCLGGKIKVKIEGKPPINFTEDMLWFFGETRLGDQARVINYPLHPQGGNMAVKTKVFDAVNGFDTNLKLYGDETEFFRRASEKGFTMYYDPEILVTQSVPGERLTNKELRYKSYIWGKGSAIVWLLSSPHWLVRLGKSIEFIARLIYIAFSSLFKTSFGKFYTFWFNYGYLMQLIKGLEKTH